jgi:peroxiredoxin
MLKTSTNTLKPGGTAPDFELPTAKRKTVRLSDYRGKRVALVFIRGTW